MSHDSLPVCSCTLVTHGHGTADMYEIHGCGCVPCTAANNVRFRQRRSGALPVCDCPRSAHVHGTRIMYNKHRCPCTPCANANFEYTRAYNERVSELPVCDCRRASHTHGTRDMYGYHKCRCVPCQGANREYNRRSAALRPRREMADADAARARITALRGAGFTLAEIGALCGVHSKVIEFAVKGRKGSKPTTVKATLLRSLEAISYRDAAKLEVPAGRKVDGDVPRRQIQALHSLGWTGDTIARHADTSPNNISWLLSGHGTTDEVRSAIAVAYEELRTTAPPETTPAEKGRASRARNKAKTNGWTPDTAEDHLYAAYAAA